jgi:phage terminase large subunit-like protein
LSRKEPEEFSLDKMLQTISTGLLNPLPNHLQYQPHDRQIEFHKAETKGKQFLGGNRSGKTVAGINEDIMWLRGKHPYLSLPPAPIYGRIVTVDFKNGMHKIILPQLSQWIPPSDLINGSWEDSWNGALYKLTLANGSEVEIMSHEQDLDKFAGVPRHFMHFDEEPPQDIFKECLARLTDYNGRWWMTMTPVEGMTWTYDEIWEKRDTRLITVVQVDSHDNPHVSQEGLEDMLEGYSEEERKIRGQGKYIALSGLVFKHFSYETHVLEPTIPPASWTHYMSLDAGFNNPTAVLWHAVEPRTETVITYKEHYRREWTVQQHAQLILEVEKELRENYSIVPFLSIQIEYSKYGVNLALGAKRDVNAGLDKMNNYHRLGKWFITEDCPNLLKEMRKYKRAEYATSKLRDKNNRKEEAQKKDDHAIDSSRYFFSFMPDLDPRLPAPSSIVKPNLLGAPTHRIDRTGFFDSGLNKVPVTVTYDEHVGEW